MAQPLEPLPKLEDLVTDLGEADILREVFTPSTALLVPTSQSVENGEMSNGNGNGSGITGNTGNLPSGLVASRASSSLSRPGMPPMLRPERFGLAGFGAAVTAEFTERRSPPRAEDDDGEWSGVATEKASVEKTLS